MAGRRVPIDTLIDFGVAFMTRRGVPREAALCAARVAVESEAFRQSTHGLAQYAAIHRDLGKTIDATAEPTVARRHGATAVIDGSRCLSALTVRLARATAVELARAHGTGFVTSPACAWVGALGMHLVPIAEQGLLCQAWAQNSTCRDAAPLGGSDARFSTNPIALAFPAEGHPVVADFSTTTMSMAGAHALSEEGRKTSVPRFLDRRGNPSCDPAVMDDDGTLMFMGCEVDGHKGYALSLFNEALTAMAGGSANNPAATPQQFLALLVLDPEAFGGAAHYAREMRRFLAHVRSARLRPGGGTMRLPGERGFAALAQCRLQGVPLNDGKVALLRRLAAENDLAPPV